jgi:hypothetical protein
VNIRQRNRPSFDGIAALGQIVVEKQPAQIFGVHPVWQARGIGIPGHQVAGRRPLTHQVVAGNLRPDQIVRAQQLERARHLRGVENAALPHHIFEKRDLAFVDEQGQFARLGKICLRGKQSDRPQSVDIVSRHRCGDDRQKGPAQAIAERMNLSARHNDADHGERGFDAQHPIVV